MTILDGARDVVPYAGTSEDRTSLALSAQAARVALRIAALVEANCTPESSEPAVAFLRAWAEHALQAGAGRPIRRPRWSGSGSGTSSARSPWTCSCSRGCRKSTRDWPAPSGRCTRRVSPARRWAWPRGSRTREAAAAC